MQRSPNSTWITIILVTHWASAYCTSSMHCLETIVVKLLPWTFSYVGCSCVSFASMEVVMIYASSIHGCKHTFKTASLWWATSTYSLSAFICCILVNLYVRETICAVPFTSSYFYCSSRAPVSRHCIFVSSCRVVRTSNNCSNSFVQFVTALLTSAIVVVIVLAHCSPDLRWGWRLRLEL